MKVIELLGNVIHLPLVSEARLIKSNIDGRVLIGSTLNIIYR